MNAFDKHAKRLAAWCEDCDSVFDTKLEADMHRDQQGHAVRTTEFWVTGRW